MRTSRCCGCAPISPGSRPRCRKSAGSSAGRRRRSGRHPRARRAARRRRARDRGARPRLPRAAGERRAARRATRRRASTARATTASCSGWSTGCCSCSSPRTATPCCCPTTARRSGSTRASATTRYYATKRLRRLVGPPSRRPRPRPLRADQARSRGWLHDGGQPCSALPPLGSVLWDPGHDGAPQRRAARQRGAARGDPRALATSRAAGGPSTSGTSARRSSAPSTSRCSSCTPRSTRDRHASRSTTAAGNERKTTGSYYTPTSLIASLLDSALDPVLDEAAARRRPGAAHPRPQGLRPGVRLGPLPRRGRPPDRQAARGASASDDGASARGDPARAARRRRPLHLRRRRQPDGRRAVQGQPLDGGARARPAALVPRRTIVLGNSLLGATPALIAAGHPRRRVQADRGRRQEDRRRAAQAERQGARGPARTRSSLRAGRSGCPRDRRCRSRTIAAVDDDSLAGVREQQRRFEQLLGSPELATGEAGCRRLVRGVRRGQATWRASRSPRTTLGRALERPAELRSPTRSCEVVAHGRGAYAFLHWHVAFPAVVASGGGFDVVLGNPPWERVKLQEKEFFAARSPEIANAPNKAARERLIAALAEDDPALVRRVRGREARGRGREPLRSATSGRYPLCGRGDVNTYSIFAELMRNVDRADRPRRVHRADRDRHRRHDEVLLPATSSTQRSLVSLFGFENEEFIFPACISRNEVLPAHPGRHCSGPSMQARRSSFFAHRSTSSSTSRAPIHPDAPTTSRCSTRTPAPARSSGRSATPS